MNLMMTYSTLLCWRSPCPHQAFPGGFWVTRHGDERIRTADPLLARQVLSQLSYAPHID